MKKLFSKLMLVAMAATLFVACEDVPEPYSIPEATPAEEITYTGSGTLENPYTCADVIKYVQSLDGEESAVEVYVKGIVVEVREAFTTQYGNGTFTMSDDGTPANVFTAYRVLYLGNKKYSNGKEQIKAGDEVIVYGKVVNFKGNTPETVQGSAFLYSLNGVTEGEPSAIEGEPTGSGTLEDPFNSVAAIKYAQEVGDTESPKEVYIKGKVASITEQYGTQFGNATFTISDDGTANGAFTIYRALYLGNQKYTSGDLLKEKDDVIVCGKVTNYRGNTPETVQGSAYLYSLNGKTGGSVNPQPGGEAKGSGTLEDPYNAAAANAYASSLAADVESDKDIYIKGKIIDIAENNQFNTQYGNCTFYISDDGTDTGDKFYVFRTLYLGNVKYTSGDLPKKGDEVIICGKVVNYKGNTPETAANKSYIYSLNGKTEGGGSTPDPQPSDEVKTVTVAEFNAAEVSDVWYQLKGKVTNLKDGDIYGNFDLVDETGSVYVYGLLSEKGGAKKLFQDLVAAKGIKEGSTITIIGNRGEYNGKIEVMNAYFVSIEGGSDNPNPGGGGGEVSGNSITVNAADFGFEDKGAATSYTLSDGTKIVFDKGEGTTAPAYYAGNFASVRIYAKNTVTITASKKIAKVAITTTSPSGSTKYNGNDEAYAEGSSKVSINKDSDTSVSFSGLNASTVKIVNDYSEAKGGTQLRISSMTITYAE